REFAFSEVFSREVAAAHAEGAIHVVGAEYPMHLHSVFLPLEAVKRFGTDPGAPEESVIPEDLPTLCQALRKNVGAFAGYVLGSVDVGYFNLMAAPLLGEEDPYQVAGALAGALETPAAGIPPAGATAQIVGSVPDFLRFTDAVGPGGARLGRGYGEFWTDAERLTRALVDAARGRPGAPGFYLHVDRNTFRNPSSLSLLRGLCAEIAGGLPLTFVLEREGQEMRIHSRFLTRVDDPALFRSPESARIPYAQMVVLNAAQAAFRAGRGRVEEFTDALDGALKLAVRAHQDKHAFLARHSDDRRGPYRALARLAADGKPVLDLSRGEFLVAVSGFPEAVAHIAGGRWSEGGEALKAAVKAASFLSLRVKEEARKAGIRVSMAGPCPRSATRRLFEADRAAFPDAAASLPPGGYRPGLVLSEDLPDDLLQAVRVLGNLYSLIEPSVTISGSGGKASGDPERLFDLVCEVYERTEMTFLRFCEPED
ncbi:MAG: hypothetical protein MUC63_09910, partial [Planctomycetes bacterium]|nr:hypothetical protein [Planctomycetota bacterium]